MIAIIVALVVLGTFVAWRTLPERHQSDVLVIGDSVTFLSAGAIEGELGREHVQFVAKPGYSSTRLLPLVDDAMKMQDVPAASREQVAVLVGYNDVRKREVGTAELPELVEAASRFSCGIFLTLPARPGGKDATNPAADSDQFDVWNVRLRKEVAKYPNLHVATDWQDSVTQAPVGSLLEGDGVHPNEEGKDVLASAYRRALDREC